MSEVTEETVENLAKLSRIACREEDKQRLLMDIRQVLSHAKQLAQVPTEGVEECNHVGGIFNIEREDQITESLPRETLLANAPEHAEGLICVPPLFRKQ